MNELESQLATAQELIAFAKERGVDLGPACYEWAFFNDGRVIWLWRKVGKLRYSIQGPITALPESYRASAGLFHGMWHETGSVADLPEAFEFLKAWLIDRKEVDDLPRRQVRSTGIG